MLTQCTLYMEHFIQYLAREVFPHVICCCFCHYYMHNLKSSHVGIIFIDTVDKTCTPCFYSKIFIGCNLQLLLLLSSFVFYLLLFIQRPFKSNFYSVMILTPLLQSYFPFLISSRLPSEPKPYLNFPNYLESSTNMTFSYSFVLSNSLII